MKYILFFIATLLFSDTSFISPQEYAAQIYKNPRGIGCHHCHGERGEGKLVAKYKHKGQKKEFRGPAINKIELQVLSSSLKKRIKGMPHYYLTHKEVEAIYLHIHMDEELQQDGLEIDEE
jgi:mono/diheme cytochrome c family protein